MHPASTMLAIDSASRKALALEDNQPTRRVTRSQSREVEENPAGLSGGGYHRNAGSDARQRMGKDDLEPVAEELAITPQKPRSRPDRRSLYSREDPMNMSGTTILPLESEPDTDQDTEVMVDLLETLRPCSKKVLDSLIRHSKDPLHIVNEASSRTQLKRLQVQISNLNDKMRHFGNLTYIDVGLVKRAVEPNLQDEAAKSKLEPTLHRANCARFALEALLAADGVSRGNAITALEGSFPAPFSNGLMASSFERATFDLALDIRTQFLIMKLEAHEHQDDVHPIEILNGVFYDEVIDESDDDQSVLRGFGLDPFQDENGRLPERFWDAVVDRIDDIRASLVENDVEALKASYPWRKFCLRTVRWVWRIDYMLDGELGGQKGDLHEDRQRQQPRYSVDGTVDSPRSSIGRVRRWSTVQPTPSPTKKAAALPTAVRAREPAGSKSPSVAMPTAQSKEPAEPGNRRKSYKGPFFNATAIERLKERRPTESAETHKSAASGSAQEPRRRTLAVLPQRETSPGHPEISFQSHVDRRQTLAAPGTRRNDRPEQPITHAPSTFHASGAELFVSQGRPEPIASDDENVLNDSHDFDFDLDEPGPAVEKSLSPVLSNRNAVGPETAPQATQNSAGMHDSRFSADHILAIANQHKKDNAGAAASNATAPDVPGPSQRPRTSPNPQPGPSRPTDRPAATHKQRFIDRQINARRISSIDEVSDTPSTAPQRNKRTREEIEDSEDDFGRDTRAIDTASKRLQKPHSSHNKRRRVERESDDDSASQLPQGLDESTQPIPATPSHQTYRRTHRPRSPSIPGLRRRWTQEQDDALIEYIAEYGAKWSLIEEKDGNRSRAVGGERLGGRNQGQLKDRARNLRNKLLREGMPWHGLPRNFDHITFGAKDRNQLGPEFEDFTIP